MKTSNDHEKESEDGRKMDGAGSSCLHLLINNKASVLFMRAIAKPQPDAMMVIGILQNHIADVFTVPI
jgi:hypothetical protein